MSNETILVTGATGKQGGATARRLLAAGQSVRVLVRDADAPAARELAAAGAELAVGDFDAPDTVAAAVAGVRAVFLIPPAIYGPTGWNLELEAARGEKFIEVARASGVDRIVFSGIASFDSDRSWGAEGKRRIEDAVIASGMRWTILRPVRFMENYLLRGSVADGIVDGVHRHLFPADRPIQIIAVDDVAAIAVLALTDPDRFHGRTLELAGDAVPFPVAAQAITRATGIEIRYEEISEAEAAAMGPEIAGVWQKTRAGVGWHADIAEVREILPSLRTLDGWLAETGAAQIKSLLTH